MSQQNSEALSADGLAVAPVTVNVLNFDQASGFTPAAAWSFCQKVSVCPRTLRQSRPLMTLPAGVRL